MATIPGAHHHRHLRCQHLVNLRRAVNTDHHQGSLFDTTGAQHIQAGAVTVIDAQAETLRGADHVRVSIDDGDLGTACQQGLADHLADPAKADHKRLPELFLRALQALTVNRRPA